MHPTPMRTAPEEEEEAMEAMLSSAAAEEMPGKPSERPDPEQVLGEVKAMASKMQELLARF